MTFKRILLADPNPTLAQSYRKFLGRKGVRVETAGDGLECVAKLRAFRPDLLVMDPELPWGGGEGLLARMQEEGTDLPRVPVLLLSEGYDARWFAHVGEEAVSAHYLKPLSPELLCECIERLFRKQTGLTPSRSKPSFPLPDKTPGPRSRAAGR